MIWLSVSTNSLSEESCSFLENFLSKYKNNIKKAVPTVFVPFVCGHAG